MEVYFHLFCVFCYYRTMIFCELNIDLHLKKNSYYRLSKKNRMSETDASISDAEIKEILLEINDQLDIMRKYLQNISYGMTIFFLIFAISWIVSMF